MEIVSNFVNNQLSLYIIPVVLVSVVAVLLYSFSIRQGEQPAFDKLTNDDRKQAGKKKKIKEKKPTANGHVSTGDSKLEKSPVKESKRSPAKEVAAANIAKDKKIENNKLADRNKKNELLKREVMDDGKNKKNLKKGQSEKPVDFDDGDWEKVPSKAEKKKKPDQSPIKKERKVKKTESKLIEIEKLVKEEVNKELREKEKDIKEPKIQIEVATPIIIEEKKEKKKEKKAKKENVEKPPPPPPVEETPAPPPKPKPSPPENKDDTSKAPAFDALGDVWEEPKTAKKSKKKARRDN